MFLQDMLQLGLREGGLDHEDTPMMLTRLAMLFIVEQGEPTVEVTRFAVVWHA